MLQWRNWHTRQIQTLFSPGSTPGWSTIFEINSGGDFVNNISAVAIGMLIAAHREGDEEKFRAYVYHRLGYRPRNIEGTDCR